MDNPSHQNTSSSASLPSIGALKARLGSLVAFLDFRDRLGLKTEEASEKYKDQMVCKAGCSSCCKGDFKISPLEGLLVKKAVEELTPETQSIIVQNLANHDPNVCPLLVNDQCSIYTERPILCRIFGFPISNGETIATCELNFTQAQNKTFEAQAFSQPAISESLNAINQLYLSEVNHPLAQQHTDNTDADTPIDIPSFTIYEILTS